MENVTLCRLTAMQGHQKSEGKYDERLGREVHKGASFRLYGIFSSCFNRNIKDSYYECNRPFDGVCIAGLRHLLSEVTTEGTNPALSPSARAC